MNLKNNISLLLTLCVFCCNLAIAGVTSHTSNTLTTNSANSPQSLLTGLPVVVQGVSAAPGQQFCVNVTTSEFDSIVSMQYTMNWDPTVIKFLSATLVNMPHPANFGFGSTNACDGGVLAVSWHADQDTIGHASVGDGTVLYELCFEAIGVVGTCTDLAFTGDPLTIEVISAGSNGGDIGLDNTDGVICIIEPVDLVSADLSHVNCSNPNEGAIDITFIGGTAPYSYQWSGPGIMNPTAEDHVDLTSGTYYLTLTDASVNPLIWLDTFEIIGNFDIGIANAGVDTSLNCYNNGVLELNGSSTPNGSEIFHEWYTNDGCIDNGVFTLAPEVSCPGTYCLVTFNNISNCSDTSCVVVTDQTNQPLADAGVNDELTCLQSMLTLNGTNSEQGSQMIYTWTTVGGNIINGDSTLTPLINAPGTYTLEILNTLSGCVGTSDVVITQDNALPDAIAAEADLLTCIVNEVTLDGTASSTGVNFSYLWTTTNGSNIVNPTSLTPTVSQAGTYTLVVTDNSAMCSATTMIDVSDDMIPPSVDAGETALITCSVFAVQLDGTASGSTGTGFSYLWTTTDGNISDGETSLLAEIDACGTYMLEITNSLTGCVNSSSVLVECDTVAPIINFGNEPVITCDITEVTLDASGSSTGSNYTYTWTPFMGNLTGGQGTLVATADDCGQYSLLIEDVDNGCFSIAAMTVSCDTMAPIANAGMPVTIECGDPVLLDGSNSQMGDTITYNWTTTNGSITANNTTTAPEVDTAGEYTIWVTNTANGCSATSIVLVDGAAALEDAMLEGDSVLCGDETDLVGNLPLASTGVWTTSNPNDFIADPLAENTLVMDMEAGWHTFFWTLSTAECPDYDMDSLQVYVEGTPDAIEDEIDLSGYITSHEINLLDNDETTYAENWTVALLSTPDAGEISDLNGGLATFTFPAGYFGTTSFEYELCNELCPDQCDTTVVLLNISEPIDTIVDIPSGITPNGDGTNDDFIIPEIKKNPELYPDNELLIFNRWGDVVYKAKPYNNDWNGTSTSGNELPQGTYYYLLRLDVGAGLIYNGDITILR